VFSQKGDKLYGLVLLFLFQIVPAECCIYINTRWTGGVFFGYSPALIKLFSGDNRAKDFERKQHVSGKKGGFESLKMEVNGKM
jgi:hypothetical protein